MGSHVGATEEVRTHQYNTIRQLSIKLLQYVFDVRSRIWMVQRTSTMVSSRHTHTYIHAYKDSYTYIQNLVFYHKTPHLPTLPTNYLLHTHTTNTTHNPNTISIIISGYVPHSTCSCFFHAYPKHETPRTETLTDKETVVYVFLNKGHGFLRLLSNLISSELSLKVRYQFGL